jgi:predicted pyridoxine 5'-phosphate oxidase superfamily flavin-nucleotide-binding protein
MNTPTHQTTDTAPGLEPLSPFHPGEQAVQITAGVRDEAEARGQKMLTPRLVSAQREFFANLSFAVYSQLDAQGQPWAGLLTGESGFIQAHEDGSVRIGQAGTRAGPAAPDTTLLTAGSQLGMLGIEFARRRRNRINGTVSERGRDYVSLMIDQGYGNCPKYITKRDWDNGLLAGDYSVNRTDVVSDTVSKLVTSADTFFIASSSGPAAAGADNQPQAWGADVSHRGGEPGFVELVNEGDSSTLYFDDYPGNNLYNTLGNLQAYPKCGLLFMDFVTGDVVQLAGTAELNHGAERFRIGVGITEVVHWVKQVAAC